METINGKTSVPIIGKNVPKRTTSFLPGIGKFVYAIFGWGFKKEFPNIPKFVIAFGPHTSNWDFVFGIAGIFILGAKISWMGKHTLFRKPFGVIVRWLGGMPIDRSSPYGMVDTMINHYKNMDQLILAIAPEGTRKKVDRWKSGFYHIARGADVPILMACFDYKNKVINFGPLIYPSGDFDADMEKMQSAFEKIRGKKSQ